MTTRLPVRDQDHFIPGKGGCLSPMQEPALFGFSRDNWSGDSYLWVKPETREVWVSLIFAREPGRGDFSRLVREIERQGWAVVVPTPFAHMQAILERWGFVRTYQDTEIGEPVEAWRRP